MKWGFIIFMAGALACRATDRFVATNGSDDAANPGTSWGIALRSISNGVAKATTAGDVVWVSNGVYVLTTNITIETRDITLRGLDRTNTIIQGQYPVITNRGLYINRAGATVEEFTVRGFGLVAYGDRNGKGGGVYLDNGTLRNCIIATNTASGNGGGGVYITSGLVTNCVIRSNTMTTTYQGGGIYLQNGQVWNCTISDNICSNANGGGGVYMAAGIVANSTISNNTTPIMDGAGCYIAGGVISNCTIANNWIPDSAVSKSGAGIYVSGSGIKIYSSIIKNNSTFSYAGGGIYVAGSVLVQDCTIEGNYALYGGGGIQLSSGSATLFITNCTISSNRSGGGYSGGAGINCQLYSHSGVTAVWCRVVGNVATNTGAFGAGIAARGNLVLDHCTIEKNVLTNAAAYLYGAGLYLTANSQAQVKNCLIAQNSEYRGNVGGGGGIYIEAGAANLFSACTIAGNYSKTAGGGIYLVGDGSDAFTNCIVASNSSPASADNNIYMATSARSNAFYYSCSDRLTNTVQGNITDNPLFPDAASDNFRLGRGSPGINAGMNEGWMTGAVDLDGRSRIDKFSQRVDMGAYEYLPQGVLFKFR